MKEMEVLQIRYLTAMKIDTFYKIILNIII